MRYQGQDFLTAPARQSPELWRFGLGLALVLACYLALGHSYFTLLAEMVTPQDWPLLAAEIDRGSSPRGMLAILASFGFIIIALGLVLKFLHQRPLATLFGRGAVFLRHGLPALIFGALHFEPSVAGPNAWFLVLSATLFGLAAGDLTARSGTLAPAIALHFFLNFSGLLYVSPGDTLYGLALYTYPFKLSDPTLLPMWMPYDLMILLCAWLTARLSLGR